MTACKHCGKEIVRTKDGTAWRHRDQQTLEALRKHDMGSKPEPK